jgi:hypothetical protein
MAVLLLIGKIVAVLLSRPKQEMGMLVGHLLKSRTSAKHGLGNWEFTVGSDSELENKKKLKEGERSVKVC